MIVECEKCHTKFRLDDSLLKKTGSKVRCSFCDHKFIVFPPKASEQGLEEPAVPPRQQSLKEQLESDFEKTLVGDDIVERGDKEALEELSDIDQTLVGNASPEDEIEPIAFEDISQIDSGIIREASPDVRKAMKRATKVEEKIIAKEERGKEEEVPKAEEPGLPPLKVEKKKRPRTLLVVLILILLVVGGASAVVFFMPELLPESIPFLQRPAKEQPLDMGNKRLSFSNLEGSFFDSAAAGKLFVVTGSIRNNYPDKRSFIRIRSNILDSQGKVAKSKIVYAGNPISKDDLQTLSMKEIINRLMNRAGKNNINMNIPPHASVPIMIVFANLPEDVSEFTVEAISSSPARR
jgi:predicted Zn finger-like uncharacterized protein